MASVELKEKALRVVECLCNEYSVNFEMIECSNTEGLDLLIFGDNSGLKVLMSESIYNDAYKVKVINITGNAVSDELIVRV